FGISRCVCLFDCVVVCLSRCVRVIIVFSLNFLDVLIGIETLIICVAYRYRGEVIREFPANLNDLAECEAIYEELPGWNEDITDVTSLDDLPVNARHYLERISQLTEIPLSIFSVGPDRTQTNIVQSVYR